MSLFSNTANRNPEKSINTNIDTFFGDLSYLQITAWNDKVALSWTPANGKTENGRVAYARDNQVRTALSHPKVEALLAAYEKELRSHIINNDDPGEGMCVGVDVSSFDNQQQPTTTGVFIEYKHDDVDPSTNAVYVTIVKNLGPNGSNLSLSYKFEKVHTISGKGATLGNYTEGYASGEFLWFITLLKAHGNVARYGDHSRRRSELFRSEHNNNQQQQNQYQNQYQQQYQQPDMGGYNPNDIPTQAGTDGFAVFS